MKVPTSTANDGRIADTSMERNIPMSGAICMLATGPSLAVASMSECCTSSTGVVWEIT